MLVARALVTTVLVATVLAGCGGGDVPPPPAPDAGAASEAAPPVLAPCAGGWRELTGDDGATICEPWPEGGAVDDCAFDAAHLPGTPGCARVGPECPADGWPERLPGDRAIVWVDDGASAGGDGSSRERALRSIAAALVVTPEGAIVAVAAGRYDEPSSLVVGRDQTLWGACVAETRITARTGNESIPMIQLREDGASVRSLSIDAPLRSGIGARGVGVVVQDVVVRGARIGGLAVSAGSTIARGLVVRDIVPGSGGPAADGIRVDWGGRLVLEGASIERVEGTGLAAIGEATTLEARDLAVRDTVAPAIGTRYAGVAIRTGSSAMLERVVVERTGEHGIFVDGVAATLDARDVVVRDVSPRGDGSAGRGVYANDGARATLARVLVERAREAAIQASGAGTSMEARDVVVRDALDRADGALGRGVQVQAGAQAVLARVALSRCREGALFVSDGGSAVEGEDVVIRTTIPGGSGAFGMGAWVQSGATLALRRARIEDVRFVGVGATFGARAALEDVAVARVSASACAASTCATLGGGFGLSAHFGGEVRASGFRIDGAALCGVVVGEDDASPTAMDVERGVISDVPIGACVQVEGYDTARLRSEVEYRDVGVPLQATSYDLPDALPGE